MKYIALLIIITVSLFACTDMYEYQEKYEGEIVYPARFDTIIGLVGYERVELELMKAGRIPSKQINLGKAQKTIVEYDDKVVTIDSLVSYVNITGLTSRKLYRFKVYTIDEYGNKSVPQEIALIPFTSDALASMEVSTPRILKSPTAAVVDWPNGLSSVLLDYYGLSFEYEDKDGIVRLGERGENARFFVGNVAAGEDTKIKVDYKIVPLVNGKAILDTVILSDELMIDMPTGSTEFSVAEREVLLANGVETFTSDGVSAIEKLVFPIHANSLQDIFYFPNLKELDLTGGDLFTLPELTYDRNGVVDIVGGGSYSPFMKKTGGMAEANAQSLIDLLESGILEKVTYYSNSMGLDEMLKPYINQGVVEVIQGASSVLIDKQFLLDGNVQSSNFNIDITYPYAGSPVEEGIENAYKVACKAKSASLVFALPKEYEFNIEDYRYLKFKVYAPSKDVFSGTYAPFQRLWPRFMNRMWSFGGNSSFGQQYWALDKFSIEDDQLQKWTDVTIDMTEALDKHNRVIILNIGGEPGVTPSEDIIYYFGNIRFEKE
ncbi:DUF4998 domain-containing protein [Sunxiuqinia elliptica]|uniref:Uncharacterized protein n=1 Tax=Sunxiuqinia elliptica TaxID=655355 RepID=A0A1I2JJ44_9BACT|nr:DUF4998 domain-containing protein [Sunxiuqinia elliptica]SFF53177.1 protein of unknown function [Sunxiuqinia elliptica]